MTTPPDDSMMSRFDEHGLRRFRARDAVGAIALAALLLVLFEGPSMRNAAERMDPGIGRTLVLTRRAARRLDRRPAAARGRGRQGDRVAVARRGPRRPGRLRQRRRATPRPTRGSRRSRAPRSTPPTSAPSPRRGDRSTRCSSRATRWRSRSTPSWRGRSRRPTCGWSATRISAPASRSRSSSTGASCRPVRWPSTSPTPSSCSSAPTRASRWRGPAAPRWSAAARTGRRSTPAGSAG